MIQLTDYKPTFENSVYKRKDTVQVRTDGGFVPSEVSFILLPKRYSEPTEDSVVEYIRKKADLLIGAKRLLAPENLRSILEGKSELEQAMLVYFPAEFLEHLASGRPELLDNLRSKIPVANPPIGQEPAQYVTFRYGVIPTEVIKENEEHITDASWYDSALSDMRLRRGGFGEKFLCTLTLEDGALPSRDRIHQCIDLGASKADAFSVNRFPIPKEMLRTLVDLVYNGLKERSDIILLPDCSEEKTKEVAAKPIELFANQFQEFAQMQEAQSSMQQQMRLQGQRPTPQGIMDLTRGR